MNSIPAPPTPAPSLPPPFPGAPRPNPLAMPPKDPLDRLRVESPREANLDCAVVFGLMTLPWLIQYGVPGGAMRMWGFTRFLGTVPLFGSPAAIWMVTRRAARVAACAAPGFREEVRLAGLAPSACLEARLDPVRRRLVVLLLLMTLPNLCFSVWNLWQVAGMERSAPPGSGWPSITNHYLAELLARYVGVGMLVMIARSAFDEMAIHAVSPGATAGTIAACGTATLILRQIPAWAGGWVVKISLPMLLMTATGDSGPTGAAGAADSIGMAAISGFGLVILATVFHRIRARRTFARERMDALG